MCGSCACGAIQYEYDGDLRWMNHCHCSTCRKVHGAVFGTFGHGPASQFRWLQGEALVERWASSPTNTRNFCRICGSNVPTLSEAANHVRIPMGTVDDEPGFTPKAHYFVGSKAAWHEITDELPQYEGLPPTK